MTKGTKNLIDCYQQPTQFCTVNDEILFSQEYWEEVEKCKESFITFGKDPKNCYVRKEVAESWIRSKNYGVSPETRTSDFSINESESKKIRQKNQLLIEVAAPLINNFMELATSSGYTLGLFDNDGIFLVGSHQKINPAPIDIILNEKTTGTTAHCLAMFYKKPFQLIGPENYLKVWHNTINFSAPILDENGKVLGALALRHYLGPDPWKVNLEKTWSHSLGWVSSLAIAIESQLKLYKSYTSLKKASQVQGVTLELFEEGILTLNSEGVIVRANREGSRILHLSKEEVEGHNISEFLTCSAPLLDALKSWKNIDFSEETIKTKNGDVPYLVSVRPVLCQDSGELDYVILKFNYPEKINALVTSRSGASASFSFDDIIGESTEMLKAKKLALRFANSRENILILGESGTGKELFAQAIHNKYCPSGPFIAVNCAAMPRNLIESELFGYERGAFTGAEKSGRPGKIELANGGSLFLDEIGDMPFEIQSVLLRVLQDKQVMRLGGKHYQKINFRLIAATNQNLIKSVQRKTFREDLYFRLSVLNIQIPPLRNREYDIELLADYFLNQYAKKMGWPTPSIKPSARSKILEYNWPGNVRQLENAVIYAVNVADDKAIDVQHLPPEIISNENSFKNMDLTMALPNQVETTPTLPEENSINFDGNYNFYSVKNFEKLAIKKALKESKNLAVAAKLLEISIPTLYRKIKEYNIEY